MECGRRSGRVSHMFFVLQIARERPYLPYYLLSVKLLIEADQSPAENPHGDDQFDK